MNAHYFTPQLHPRQHTHSYRETKTTHRKRKRSQPSDANDDDYSSSSSTTSSPSSPTAPHRPSTLPAHLSALNPPLYPPTTLLTSSYPNDTTTNLKQQHLKVITTILHQCLERGDFLRAGRAWALILRAGGFGDRFDLRREGAWGVAGELLLRGAGRVKVVEKEERKGEQGGEGRGEEGSVFSREGFAAARQFYERLILQYPVLRTHPHGVNALTFYPAMFGVWIVEVQETVKELRKRAHEERGEEEDESPRQSTPRTSSGSESERSRGNTRHTEIKQFELAQAQEIAQRMDALLTSPPYDKSVPLLQLRGMLALWTGDLLYDLSVTEGEDDENALGEERRNDERRKAKEVFDKAKAAGSSPHIDYYLAHFDWDV